MYYINIYIYYIYIILYILSNLRHSRTNLGSFWDPLWAHLGLSWAVFGAILRNLSQSWTILGPCLGYLEQFWHHLGNIFEFIKKNVRTRWVGAIFFLHVDNMGPKMVSKFGTCWGHLWDDFLNHFLVTFWITFGDHFGTHFRTRASKTKKATFSKKWFSRGTVCIFSLLRPPKELLNPKKKGSKIDPKINKFWTNFGVQMGLKSIPQNYSKKNQKY